MNENCEQYIEYGRQRLDIIHKRVIDSSKLSQKFLTEVLSELALFLEELHIVTEELQQKNEELIATRSALELERQRYQDLFEFALDGYLVTDANGIISQANHAVETMLGVRSNRLVGKPLMFFIPENERSLFQTQLNKLSLNNSLLNWSIELKSREGQSVPAQICLVSQKDNQQNLVKLFWLIRNISDVN